jgi:DNA-binding HxlR family transcriptional regulator
VARSYSQHCSLAHALDVVGERWTLLIVRELMAGPRRYTDLAAGLVTVPSNVLAVRLKDMEAHGLIARRPLPAPAASVVVYELTESGEGLGAAVTELARWGMRTLPPEREDRAFRVHWLVLALRASFDPAAAAGLTESYEFVVDGESVSFELVDGEGVARVSSPAASPAVVVTADADTLLALTSDAITGIEAIARGARFEGTPRAIERMRRVLPSRQVNVSEDHKEAMA